MTLKEQVMTTSHSSPDSNENVERALEKFLNTHPWQDKLPIVEQERALLLTDLAETLLAEKIEELEQSTELNEQHLAQYIALHRALICRAREVGVSAAWA